MDKTKEWELEMLMEKLRAKSGQFKTFFESAKSLRMALLEKRYPVDSVERAQLHKCLDTLQHNIKVTTVQAMVERLESVSRQLGLKFVAAPSSSGLDFFISSDMFYLELVLEPTGSVKDVKVHHEGKVEQPQSCEELVACLSRRDFADFTAQLEGLASIYQLNAEKKVKSKAYAALTSLENDLQTLAISQSAKDPQAQVLRGPVGILHKRRGGHCMKLVYFMSPYEMLDPVTCVSRPVTNNLVTSHCVTVSMEGSSAHKLQTTSLVSHNRTPKGSVPMYAPLTSQNCASLPACFVLKLPQPMPMCVALARRLQSITDMECADLSSPEPLLSLIAHHASDGQLDTRGLTVNLPDQQHCYFMTDSASLLGVLVRSVPFTLPQHVPAVLACLRHQAVFNCVVASCIRNQARQTVESESCVMLEVTALSWQRLSVSLEHPVQESMATVELDLTDVSYPRCHLYTAAGDSSSDYATKVFQRCLSIPVTMRALIKRWQREGASSRETPEVSGPASGSLGGSLGGLPGGDPEMIIKQEPGSGLEPFTGAGDCPSGLQLSEDKALMSLLCETKQSKKRKLELSSKKFKSEDCENITLDSSSDDSILSKELEFDLDLIEKKKSPPSILLELENKNLVPPSVSITPITCSSMISPTQCINSVLERRPGIEIIPLQTPLPLPSSITITPISNKEERMRKGGKSSKSDDKSRTEKKKRRRKEDSDMGPPEKLPMKQDPLTKPVTVSIKPADCGSPRPVSPNSNLRKYSSSPTPLSLVNSKGSPKSVKHSPKHSPSPAYSVSSPKSSPKHGTSSPKHQGSSGKPSMSALKSAASSPKSDSKKSSSSKDSSRDKDRKSSSSGHQSPKLKQPSVKLKQLDLSSGELTVTTSGGSTPPGTNDGKAQPMVRNRKGSLSAIVDKLKSAQHCGDLVVDVGTVKSGAVKERSTVTISKTIDKCGTPGVKPGDNKNPTEYMVKPSSDGMKITINKTRTKDPNKSKSSSLSNSGGSPKTHTGLKPGVNSGPASKKPSQPVPKSPTSKTLSKNLNATKSSSNLKLVKSSGNKDNRPRSTKPGDKSIFSSSKSEARKLSPNSLREDSDSFKLLNVPTISPELVAQGFMKQLDTKFQIPKLSQRTVNDDLKKDKFDASKIIDQNKFMDISNKSDSKYSLLNKLDDIIGEPKQISPSQSLKSLEMDITEVPPVIDTATSSAKDDILSSLKIELPIGSMSFNSDDPLPDIHEPTRLTEPSKTMPTPEEAAAEILLDFSTLPTKSILPEKLMSVPERAMASVMPLRKNTPPPPPFPNSPSVSIHIVKSPVPSPLIIPSPHSASPCITDDELMDEALVGISK